MNTRPDTMRLYELTLEAFEGSISEENFTSLQSLLKDNPVNQSKYAEMALLFTTLKNTGQLSNSENILDNAIWQALSEYERTAQGIEVFNEPPHQPEACDKVTKLPRGKYRISKYNLAITVLSLAAVLFMVIYIRFMPPRAFSVASVTDSMNAKWANSNLSTSSGTRIKDHQKLQLLKGVAKIEFDYGAEVIVEAPAEIQLESPEKMTINYGRLFAHVPQLATGFTVGTPASKVIDIGTEFGIEVDFTGNTDVHMFKGKASLVAGRKGEKKQGMELVAGQARMVSQTGQIGEIHLKKEAFVRKFDSQKGLLWRGEALNLADIVGDGDGFGTGTLNEGIDVVSGHKCRDLQSDLAVAGANHYTRVSDSRYIDGVFVVNNRQKEVQIDAGGHHFDPGYKTEGSYWGYITNGAFHEGIDVQRHALVLDGHRCGTKENPAIGIHSNMGITFDLNEVRKQLPGIVIRKFTAVAGVSETVENASIDHLGKVDFWVLVDGEVKFSKRLHWRDGACPIDIPVKSDNRFLTLIVTDAGDNDNLSFDWAMFVNPMLELR